MSLIWVICGAGRGVGKTTLALNLRKALPGSVYAKCGCSAKKAGKPSRYFRNITQLQQFIKVSRQKYKHIIVESNAMAKGKRGDIIIFIDGIAGKTSFRKDTEQLRASANLKICLDAAATDWKKNLADKLDSKALCRVVFDCLTAQKRYLFGSEPVVRSKVWFESSGLRVFGKGLAGLLEDVNRLGTLQAAAKTANMSYRHAWDLIRAAEEHLGSVLIERHPGGRDGGSSTLSKDGKYLLDIFTQINKEVADFADEQFSALFKKEKINA